MTAATPTRSLAVAAALVAVLLPASPSRARPRKTPPPTRCDATLTSPRGEALSVSAWGAGEDEARRQTWRVSLTLAELHAQPETWIGLLFEGSDQRADIDRRIASLPAEAAEAARAFPVPGYTLADPTCQGVDLPRSRPQTRWTATWPEGARRDATATDAAVAIEAARRRACIEPYQRGVAAAWTAVASAGPDEARQVLLDGLGRARDELARCYAATPDIAAAEGTADPPGGDLFECTAAEPAPGEGRVLTRGWGPSLERAAEAALQRLPHAVARSALARAAGTLGEAAPDQRAALLAAQAERLTLLVSPDDAGEAAQLRCAVISGDAGAAHLVWTPSRPDVRDTCTPEGGWSAADVPLSDPLDPAAARDELLRRLVYGAHAAVRRAAEAAPEGTSPGLTGLATVALCEVDALGHAAVTGAATTPVAVPDAPDRSSPTAARATLDAALGERQLLVVLSCLHPDQKEPLLSLYRRLEPEAFWSRIGERLGAAVASGELAWVELDGQLVLAAP